MPRSLSEVAEGPMAVGANLMEAVDLGGVVFAEGEVGSAEADTAGVGFVEVEVGSAEVAGFAGCSPHPVIAAALTVARLQRLAWEVALTAAHIQGRLTAIVVQMATQPVVQVRVD